ncbi:MAG: iron-sulfur cluster assembly protein [Pseudomonadota bacterium]|jgi:FeS assembly SUF system protein|nr:iron-sulfur cluster assembly protein [Pseudomonadota bacterium]GIR53533.1 MAG: SUF system Fe-S cluster assembly protein [Rhodospirillaceae bacterium]MEC8234549.1 iron-sulfur cluster assembly protein [Pseudomonadota bacterium]MEC8752631.1 iron-sulfur cluster assembly protein [Pseudomonadota bacterium]MED5299605.1 iron-sulfur cluster assembly protein [Pseudomonadota bacterium]|tara:strand:+ start:150 stop:563 length:414 start_codon:yes stop_codon:yes gene_type:complete
MSEFGTETNPYGSFMTEPAVPEGTSARAGAKLVEGQQKAPDEAIVEALRTVHDPEIPVNIYDLGLIYDTERLEDGDVRILMTLTAPACPVAGEMPYDVAAAVSGVDGVGEVEVVLTWEPPWTQDRMTEDAKLILNIY